MFARGEFPENKLGSDDDPLQPRWYAAYTCVNREKRVAEMLEAKDVAHFLPLYDEVHQWKTGPARLQLPLFPGYVFVRLPLRDRLRVLTVPGVVRLVGSNAGPIPLPDDEVDSIRTALAASVPAEPHPYLTVGEKVTIISGPLRGLNGFLLRKRNNVRVVISLDLIMRSMVVEIDGASCAPLHPAVISAMRQRPVPLAA
ncbi:MAG TPA: UpxY family transcription antiterminator [Terriglobales bacterium]|nr:UpxY family transcription antiterminator [Terriglobales bacterium]